MNFRRTAGAGLGVSMALIGALSFGAPAAARDISSMQAEAQAVADRVSALETRLDDLRSERERLATDIELYTQELGGLQLRIDEISGDLSAARARYVGRAVEAYKAGPTSQLALLLSAESLADLQDIAHMADHALELDADEIDELVAARENLESFQDDVDSRKQKLLAAEREAEIVAGDMEAALSERRAELSDLNSDIARLEERARIAAERAAATSGILVGQALLDILQGSGPASGIPDGFVSTGVSFEGLASWYGPGFEGNHTANGDIFDSSLFTAASKELPLGSWLYVEFQGHGVVVYVNDRGPYVGDRILDLSRAAAEEIGLAGPGVGWVRAEILIKA